MLLHHGWLCIASCIALTTIGKGSDLHPNYIPHYALKLTLNEFSILNVSQMDGLLMYGGSGDFQLKMVKEGNNVVWNVTVDNPRLMELLGIFIGEKTMKLVQSLDPNKIDSNQRIALETIKSLSLKLEAAHKNPVWDSVKLSGTVVVKGTDWMLQTEDETFKLTGDKLVELQCQDGKAIVADGFVKMPGQFEVTRFIDKRDSTLELFVMSFCPFGQQAETKLLEFLAKTNVDPKPSLEVRYIFYKQQKDGADVFVSLHGEEEVVENLVQMVIRDRFPQFFPVYLQLRSENGRAPWTKLVEQIGFDPSDTEQIQKLITTVRDEMIRKEYEYAQGRYGITDGSPSYVWESERVPDLRKIPAFKGLTAMNKEACAH